MSTDRSPNDDGFYDGKPAMMPPGELEPGERYTLLAALRPSDGVTVREYEASYSRIANGRRRPWCAKLDTVERGAVMALGATEADAMREAFALLQPREGKPT